jgi:hypothetical protein
VAASGSTPTKSFRSVTAILAAVRAAVMSAAVLDANEAAWGEGVVR